MKLLRYGPCGQEKPGLLDLAGNVRDLSGHINDIHAADLAPEILQRLLAIDPESLPVVEDVSRLGIPFVGTRKFLGIGLNFADHATEANLPIPTEPILFAKAISCLNGPDDNVMLPEGSESSDWEVELGVVMGRRARRVGEAEALSYVAGYCVVNDVSERNYQMNRSGTWDKGKGCDTFGPVGPWLVTRDEVEDPQQLEMWLDVNGHRMQTGNTRTMIFGVAEIVSYVSQFITLEPGDIIATGTPAGVGMAAKPTPLYLKPGDVMELGIKSLGQQRQLVVGWH